MEKEITVAAKIDQLDAVLEFVNAHLKDVPALAEYESEIDICVEEVFVNIAHYAYGEEKGDATIFCDVNESRALIRLIDRGVAYNPLEREDPDITLSAEERDIGGLGIFMVKIMMDHVSYQRLHDQNILEMRKDRQEHDQ